MENLEAEAGGLEGVPRADPFDRDAPESCRLQQLLEELVPRGSVRHVETADRHQPHDGHEAARVVRVRMGQGDGIERDCAEGCEPRQELEPTEVVGRVVASAAVDQDAAARRDEEPRVPLPHVDRLEEGGPRGGEHGGAEQEESPEPERPGQQEAGDGPPLPGRRRPPEKGGQERRLPEGRGGDEAEGPHPVEQVEEKEEAVGPEPDDDEVRDQATNGTTLKT